MGRRLSFTIGLFLLTVVTVLFGTSERAPAVTASWPAAVTGVTSDVMSHMKLPLRDQILDLADEYGKRTDVPYVWGGNAIGDPATCEACRACISSKAGSHVKNRLKVCAPCRQCGIDCSHFASRFFKDAGLKFPYATTAALKRMDRETLKAKMGLIDMGRNLADAKPGDLLLHNHHVTILLKMSDSSYGDILHSSRSYKHGRLGGIQIAHHKNLLRFRGRLVKILRRVELIAEDREQDHEQEQEQDFDQGGRGFTRLDQVFMQHLAGLASP